VGEAAGSSVASFAGASGVVFATGRYARYKLLVESALIIVVTSETGTRRTYI
jgi:hypothetical protein